MHMYMHISEVAIYAAMTCTQVTEAGSAVVPFDVQGCPFHELLRPTRAHT